MLANQEGGQLLFQGFGTIQEKYKIPVHSPSSCVVIGYCRQFFSTSCSILASSDFGLE